MRLGIFVSEAWGAASGIAEIRDRAVVAESLGFPSAWVPYLPWSLDAMASMQAAGEVTSRIEVGAAVIPTYFFHPLALARQAATTQAAIGRPLHLGIGCSNPAVIAMHGLPFERPARYVREYLEILDAAFLAGTKPAGERERVGFASRSRVPIGILRPRNWLSSISEDRIVERAPGSRPSKRTNDNDIDSGRGHEESTWKM